MSFIYNNQIKYSDSPNLDAFGRLRVSEITSLVEYKHVFNKLPLIINELTAGTATSTFDFVNSQVVMTTSANNDYVIRQGKSRAIYQPGKGQLFEASFSNFQLETNVIKRVGIYTTTTSVPHNSVFDGLVLESNGQTNSISFQIWLSGTSVYSADTSSWSTEEYDVLNIDWSKTQLMYVDYQWLGVGRVRFGLVIDGEVKLFTDYTAANNRNTIYMTSPNQPVRYEIRQVGTGNGTFNMICSQVSMEGALNNLNRTLGLQAFSTQTLTTAGTKYPLIGYRVNTSGAWEGSTINLNSINIINASTPSKSDYYITVEYNPTLSSLPTFTGVTNTPVEYSLGGGRTVTSNGYILATYMGTGGETQANNFNFQDNVIKPGINIDGTADEIWICAVSVGNNQDMRSTINLGLFI